MELYVGGWLLRLRKLSTVDILRRGDSMDPTKEHSKRCRASQFAVGYDLERCPLCRVDAALELVRLRAIAQEAGVTL